MILKIIDLSSKETKDLGYIERMQKQYNEICKSVSKTRSLKKKGLFKAEMQEVEGTVSALAMTPLTRMINDDSIYKITTNIVILCLNEETDEILGFLGGIVNIMPLFNDKVSYNSLDSYDRVKYTNIYNYFVEEEEDDKEIPLAWVEIICVSPKARGQGVSTRLIDELQRYSLEMQANEEGDKSEGQIVIGLDIVGTLENGINLGLKDTYKKIGFTFPEDLNKEAISMFLGAQFAGKRL